MQKSWKYEWLCSIYIHKLVKISVGSQAESHLIMKGKTMMLHALGVNREIWNRLWIFCGDYTFGVLDLHPRGIRDSVYDQSKIKILPPMYTNISLIIFCNDKDNDLSKENKY